MFTESVFDSNAEVVAKKIGNRIGATLATAILSYPLQALGVWAFWNWLAWNVLNAPTMNYWVACAVAIALNWFFGLFKKGS